MVPTGTAFEVFGHMKKQNSSPSRNEESPGAKNRHNRFRWSAALMLGLAVAGGVGIPLEEKKSPPEINNAASEVSSVPKQIGGQKTESATPTLLAARESMARSLGGISEQWNSSANIPIQQRTIEGTSGIMETAAAAQGSENSYLDTEGERIAPQETMMETPRAPAVGRMPPVRPRPTPLPTPPPIRSPQ